MKVPPALIDQKSLADQGLEVHAMQSGSVHDGVDAGDRLGHCYRVADVTDNGLVHCLQRPEVEEAQRVALALERRDRRASQVAAGSGD